MKQKLVMLLMLLTTFTFAASAQRIGRWEKLGERSVNFRGDKDVIRSGHKGTFTRLKIRVDRAPVEFDRIFVEFANGQRQEIRVRQVIKAGGESREIYLKGNRRVIKKITFYYRSVKGWHNHRGKAKVSVWGRH
ncbi:MAG TPA: hypothetical protein DCF91_08565 [Porphyromonadaceae bacterium]|nr:hypothetical protein [Porphyromonadaceae bacterium]